MPTLRLFASAREAAGTARAEIEATTVAEMLDEARRRFGDHFGRVLDTSRVWVNGQPAEMDTVISGHDVVAVLPPVSGGSNPVVQSAPPERSVADAVDTTIGAADPPPPPLTPAAPGAPEDAGAAAVRPARPARRLRLVPPPPQDDPSEGVVQQRPTSPAGRTMGRLALASDAMPDASPEASAAPSAAPSPRPAPSLTPAPDALPTMASAVPDVVAVPAPTAEPKPTTPLAVVHHSIRPHGRLGVAWAIVTTGLLVAGPGWLALWMAVIAFVAASQTATVWRKQGERPLPGFAAAMAAGLPLTAVTGLDHMNIVVAGAIALTLVARVVAPTKAPGRDVALTLVIGLAVGMAAAAPVLLRSINIPAALYLLACAALYDAGAYLVGTGASSAWEGPAAGVAALIPLTMLAAVALVPPFHGGTPLLLGAVAAVLAPFGPVAGSALLGDRTAYAPALRRLDSLLILGPIWAWCAAALLV